jgi:hypothetical protein
MAAKVSQRGAKGFYSFTSEEAGHKDERVKNKDKKRKKLTLVISNVERNLLSMFVSSQTFKFFILLLLKPDIFSPQWPPRFRKDRNGPSLLYFFSVHTVNAVVFYFLPQWSPWFLKGGQRVLIF